MRSVLDLTMQTESSAAACSVNVRGQPFIGDALYVNVGLPKKLRHTCYATLIDLGVFLHYLSGHVTRTCPTTTHEISLCMIKIDKVKIFYQSTGIPSRYMLFST